MTTAAPARIARAWAETAKSIALIRRNTGRDEQRSARAGLCRGTGGRDRKRARRGGGAEKADGERERDADTEGGEQEEERNRAHEPRGENQQPGAPRVGMRRQPLTDPEGDAEADEPAARNDARQDRNDDSGTQANGCHQGETGANRSRVARGRGCRSADRHESCRVDQPEHE